MKIYFIASIHGKKQYDAHYRKIIALVEAAGHQIIHKQVTETTHDELVGYDEKQILRYHQKVMDNMKRAEVIFAEMSYPSSSVGYLVAMAVQLGKPVVIFYSGKEEPHLFLTIEETTEKLTVIRYSGLEDLDREVHMALEFVASAQDVRFNFFVSPDISTYLDWVSKEKKVPRSVYLRSLIDEDMRRQAEYK